MIEVKNLSKKIGSTKILDDISFSVKQGEILGFLGPNGAGKSTTMKIITSFWAGSEGKVIIDGLNVAEDSLEIRRKIGYLPENVPLYDEMRVFEYLKFIAEIRGIEKSEHKNAITKASEACGLSKVLRKPIDELSKGFRQRVGLAQAIIHEPDILILDEPTTGLDPNQIAEIRDLIKKIGKEKTVIFSTHILSEVSATCDRIIIINDGKIVGEGKPDELTEKSAHKELIYLKIKADKDAALKRIRGLENIEKVEIKDKESSNIYGYSIEPKNGVDIREYLSIAVAQQGWPILEYSRKKTSLEDVFRELTK
ncbi:MAG: ATP-binding cassette domain-containing protein [Patescibacteria group bacterium]|jgi:ABC-2 type transport system ATP-binding protein|nr:ATP-binding cassette domain-containing protein [Patescibacteria group bacterium]